jgi:hypothetical protein
MFCVLFIKISVSFIAGVLAVGRQSLACFLRVFCSVFFFFFCLFLFVTGSPEQE